MAVWRSTLSLFTALGRRLRVRLSLTQKVIGGFSLLGVLLLVSAAANLLYGQQVQQQLRLMTDNATPLVLQTNQLGKVLLNADRQLKSVPSIDDSHLAITAIDNFVTSQTEFDAALQQLQQLAQHNEELLSLIAPLASLDEDYFAQGKQLGEQHQAMLNASAAVIAAQQQWRQLGHDATIAELQPAVVALVAASDEFEFSQAQQTLAPWLTATTPALTQLLSDLQQAKTEQIQAKQQRQQLIDLTGGTIDYAIAVLGAVDQAAHQLVTDSASEVTQALHTGFWLTLGMLLSSLPLAMWVTLNIYLSIKRPLKELLQVQHAAVAGDLGQQVNYSSHNEFGLLANSTNALISHIRQMLQQFTEGASQLTQVSEQTRSRSQQTHQALDAQRAQTQQVNIAMVQLAAAVEEVAQSAALSLDSVIDMGSAVSRGRQQVNISIDGTEILAKHLHQASDSLKAVDSSANDIGGVLDVIKGVSEQTNLLALNAAIEAARAGEHGRGFAVVASEVRTLAQQTGESANTIKQIIEQLQQRAHATVTLMDNCQTAMAEGLQHSADTANCMQQIQQLIDAVSRNSEQIASAAVQQQTSCEHIAGNVRQIADITEDSYAGVSALAQSSEHLEQLVQAQEQLVNQFRA
ncbi:methyl-accepting chemotaxis protein [Shewanella sp. C32]|uniref:Methyl-accepting chemotaxis protein n=1 Tax=Shewanella electrica TaxID=515560 RepID=A0ABT2FJ42_9GAMM|nr:HAMP domain-containing methyl-accepting chemotaxis protein [Shewanella electrica]MCH1924441.1 methyl-accepting chemotaxis protein [Shewanella electrica]MCS4556342.1 methyl-accepting chemotaxis protein [Shewanella electrica]